MGVAEARSIFKGINHKTSDLVSINNKLIKRKYLLNQLKNTGLNDRKSNISNLPQKLHNFNPKHTSIIRKVSSNEQNLDYLSYNLLKNQGLASSHLEAISQLLSIMRDPAIVPDVIPLYALDSHDLAIEKLKKMIRNTYLDMLDCGVDTGPCDIAVYIKFLNSFHRDNIATSIKTEVDKVEIDGNITKNMILLAMFAQMYRDYPYWKLYRLKDSNLPITCLKRILSVRKLSEIPNHWINSNIDYTNTNNDVYALLQQIKLKNNSNRVHHVNKEVNSKIFNINEDKIVDKNAQNYQLKNFTMSTIKQHFDTKHITVKSLASHLDCEIQMVMDVAKDLVDATSYNCKLSIEESEFIAQELGYADKIPSIKCTMQTRPPIVAIMGHVDHGKTTLLDSFRNSATKITSTEVGGITQKLSAFQVKLVTTNKLVTFIDTPGHSAFTSMRSRGSSRTDIIILVVAADDGIMPQTVESYKKIISSGAELIVAINKIDRVNDTQRVKNQLLSLGIHESIPTVEISAKYGTNIEQLERSITEIAESLKLKANYHTESRGNAFILETGVSDLYGKHVTAIVTDGVLKENLWVVVGSSCCKIKRLLDVSKEPVKIAYPSQVISLIGLTDITAVAGQDLTTAESQSEANKIASIRRKQSQISKVYKLHENEIVPTNESRDLYINIIIKCVDQGSLDAILDWVNEFNQKCGDHPEKHLKDRGFMNFDMSNWQPIKIISSSVGPITRTDIQFANINRCYLVTFSVNTPKHIEIPDNITVKQHNIIYNIFKDIENIFNNHFGPLYTYTTVARMLVTRLAYISVNKSAKLVIGTITSGGTATISNIYSVLRNGVTVYEDLEILSMHVDKSKATEIPKNNSNNAIVFKQDVEVEIGDEILAQTRTKNQCD